MGLCSSLTQWPLTPHVCSWATRKLSVFIKKPYARQSGFHSFRAMGWQAFYKFFIGFIFMGKFKKNFLVFLWRKEIKEYTILLICFLQKARSLMKTTTDETQNMFISFLHNKLKYRTFFWNFCINFLICSLWKLIITCTCVCYAILLLDLFIFNKLPQSVFEMCVVSFEPAGAVKKKKQSLLTRK